MYTQQISELQDLIERPVEREWLELKSWVDLQDKAMRAGIARHLAALSNYGGGYLVFGFDDDGSPCRPHDDVRKHYNHDTIAGIIDRYLRPKFQCDVYYETVDEVEHPIVWVTPHKDTPVISKADGPHGADKKPQGIRSGVVYIRTPKPESVPITDPVLWDKLIQRCVISRRDELVAMMTALLTGGPAAGATAVQDRQREESERLKDFHGAAQTAFLAEVAARDLQRRFPVPDNFVQLSYMPHVHGELQLDSAHVLETLEKINTAVRDTVRYGWSMFHIFTREEIKPHFITDPAIDDGQTEIVQTNLLAGGQTDNIDFWRVAMDGRASLLRGFHEDRFEKSPPDLPEGTKWFDPWLHVRDLTEVARHARALSEEFDSVERISFLIEWNGLKDRTTGTINQERYVRPHTSQADRRIVAASFSQAELIGNLPGVVSNLFAPVHRLFDPRFNVLPEWVSAIMPGFIVPGI